MTLGMVLYLACQWGRARDGSGNEASPWDRDLKSRFRGLLAYSIVSGSIGAYLGTSMCDRARSVPDRIDV
jgi:hypothetical protein